MASVTRRKYLRVATDHEEVLAFLLGQLVKDKARYHTLRDGVSPSSVIIKLSEFEERVSCFVSCAAASFCFDIDLCALDHRQRSWRFMISINL